MFDFDELDCQLVVEDAGSSRHVEPACVAALSSSVSPAVAIGSGIGCGGSDSLSRHMFPRVAASKKEPSPTTNASKLSLADLARAEAERAEAILAAMKLHLGQSGSLLNEAARAEEATAPVSAVGSASLRAPFASRPLTNEQLRDACAFVYGAITSLQPTRTLRVVHSEVALRSEPHLEASCLGRKLYGDEVTVVEETFDGWVRLTNDEGWMLRDMQGKCGLGVLLAACCGRGTLVVTELSQERGCQEFEVVCDNGVLVHVEPCDDAEVLGRRDLGYVVLACTQSYNGWLRLQEDTGWIRGTSARGPLLRCRFLYERERAREATRVAAERAAKEAEVERQVEQDRRSDWHLQLAARESASASERCPRPARHARRSGEGPLTRLPVHPPSALLLEGKGLNPFRLPLQTFSVLASEVFLRSEPSFSSPVCGRRCVGERLVSSEETFDGWLLLAEPPGGWAPRVPGLVAEVGGSSVATLVPLGPGLEQRRLLEVVVAEGSPVYVEPRADAELTDRVRSFGEFVLADRQTYNGWIRLAEDAGWMRRVTLEGSMLLEPFDETG